MCVGGGVERLRVLGGVLRGRECVCWGEWSGEIACVGGGGGSECVGGRGGSQIPRPPSWGGGGVSVLGGEGAAKSPDPPVYPL